MTFVVDWALQIKTKYQVSYNGNTKGTVYNKYVCIVCIVVCNNYSQKNARFIKFAKVSKWCHETTTVIFQNSM